MELPPFNRSELASAVATVARWCRDLDTAEDAVQDALVRGLATWNIGRPANRVAWLVTAARRIVLDGLRHREVHRKVSDDLVSTESARLAGRKALSFPDEVLGMLLACCDERLPPEAQTVLALRYVAGLSVVEIARAFVCSEVALEQRLVRAKRAARELGVRFDPPDLEQLTSRLPAIHLTIYLIFNEGYAVTQGAGLLSNEACQEAIFLAKMLLPLVPNSTETLGLLALMKLQASRADARVGSDGALLRLHEQDRSLWNAGWVEDAFRLLSVARSTGRPPGPYELQAAIALHHANAPSFEKTDWPAVVGLYDCLATLQPDPVTRLNRAIAIGRERGPAAALPLVEQLAEEEQRYPLVAAVRADLLFRLGSFKAAGEAFESAHRITRNLVERSFLEARIAACQLASESMKKVDGPPTSSPQSRN